MVVLLDENINIADPDSFWQREIELPRVLGDTRNISVPISPGTTSASRNFLLPNSLRCVQTPAIRSILN